MNINRERIEKPRCELPHPSPAKQMSDGANILKTSFIFKNFWKAAIGINFPNWDYMTAAE